MEVTDKSCSFLGCTACSIMSLGSVAGDTVPYCFSVQSVFSLGSLLSLVIKHYISGSSAFASLAIFSFSSVEESIGIVGLAILGLRFGFFARGGKFEIQLISWI